MNKYEQKLKLIIYKYNLPSVSQKIFQTKGDANLELLDKYCVNSRVALWGAGDGNIHSVAHAMLDIYATYLVNTICLIDSNPKLQGTEFMGLPVRAPEEISALNIETIVISSGYRAQEEIRAACKIYAPNCNVVVPNLNMFTKAFRESNLYLYINKLKITYESAFDKSIKTNALKELIAVYLSIKDFAFAFLFIDEYLKCDFPDADKMLSLKEEIINLLSEMKEYICNREKDILIFFPDRLNRAECNEINMFSYMKERALTFENANSTGLYTFESLTSILKEKMPLEDAIYEEDLAFPVEEVPILVNARTKGYEFHVNSIQGFPIFSQGEISFHYSAFVSEKLWNVLCSLCLSNKKILDYVYVYETHYPELCGYHPNKSMEELEVIIERWEEHYRSDYLDCLKYVDKQLEFYYNFFPKNMIIIIHSDHGFLPAEETKYKAHDKWLLSKKYCVEIPFIIQGANRIGTYHDMFSMIDFSKIVNQVINGEQLKIPERTIINYQMKPIHRRSWREQLKQQGKERYMDEIDIYASKDYIHLIAARHWKEVYRLENVFLEITDTDEGKEFIRQIDAYRLSYRKVKAEAQHEKLLG